MPLSDDELLDFDQNRLADFDPVKAEQHLAQHGDVYRVQLIAARWIDGWRRRMADDKSPGNLHSEDFGEGADYALREVIAHLRQGDLLPGGMLYEDEIAGKND